jgi:hypothetical protein
MKKRLICFLMLIMPVVQAMALSTSDYLSNDYVGAWGRLKLVTTEKSGANKVQLADENGRAVQLRGWATHGFQWSGTYFNKKSDFESMKRLGANVVRLTCYVSKNEITLNQWNNTKVWLKNAITWCAELGLYAIVDYHVLTPGDPNLYLEDAARETPDVFFSDVSTFVKENNYHHVIYEICNEPNGTGASWAGIKNYAAVILPVIAENDPDAVVIVGTPQWSQRLTDARNSPIVHESLQIMYAFHTYVCTHKLTLLNQHFTETILRTIPVFVTEWNDTEASGEGSCGTPPSSVAVTFLDRCNNDANQRVSWTSWCWSRISRTDQQPTSFTWKRETPTNGTGYIVENFSPTGLMVYNELQQNHLNYDENTGLTTPESAAFAIYPNPAKDGNFNVTLANNETSVLTVVNLQGQVVYNTVIDNGFALINTNLGTGVYIVSVRSESGLRTERLVVK